VGYEFHPLLMAKITGTINYVSGGRLGVNIVAAHDPVDYAQFGFEQARTPAERYEIADEFTTLLKYLWTSEHPIDFEGDYFRTRGGQINPRPASKPRPLLINAAGSDLGIDYACRQCDAIFISARDRTQEAYAAMAEKIHSTAASYGRKVRICAMCYVVMEDTDEKAAETVNWLADEVDIDALKNQFWRNKPVYHQDQGEADDPYLGLGLDWFRARGLGMGGYQLFGSYETVADQLAGLHEAGVEHVALCFFDPNKGVQQMGEHVIPLLRERGLRATS
jgi:FMNH2-dependent dimethyl sulfone monooxygenase